MSGAAMTAMSVQREVAGEETAMDRFATLVETVLSRPVQLVGLAEAMGRLDEDGHARLSQAVPGQVVPVSGPQSICCAVILRQRNQTDVLVMLVFGREPLEGREAEQLGLLVRTGLDLAEAEQARDHLRHTLDKTEEMSGVAWWRLRRSDNAVAWSRRMNSIHGIADDLGSTLDRCLQRYHEDDRQILSDAIATSLETGEGYRLKVRIYAPDGTERIALTQCICERDSLGQVIGLVGVIEDITERETLMAKLRRNEARYRLLAENVSDVLTRVRMDGSSSYISPAIKQLLGWTLEEMSGQSTDYVYKDDRPKVLKAIQAAVLTGRPTRLEHRAVHRNGDVLWVECTFKALRDDKGEVDDVVVVIRDATHRKALEREVLEAKERAEKAAEAKSEFLANMSHELRTPLTSVIGYSGLLKSSDGLTDEQRLYAERISASSEALMLVINDILDYSKLEAGAVELDKASFDVRQHMNETLGIIANQCAAKGLALRGDFDDKLPEILSGDAGRLRQVTLNFLSNAVKFTGSGSVTLRARGAEIEDGRYRVRVEVADTGIGLSPDKSDLVFGRFTQADASTTRTYGGTGLGLAISRHLIELMGGEIGYTSVAGEGATFWYEVPLDFDFSLPVSVAVENEPSVAVNGRILLVDDAPANRELVSIILKSLGLEVETACDGVEAVAAVRSGAFDLVLMDVHMPQMDGLTATREIRRSEEGAEGTRLPILALTANVQADQIERCAAAGMDGHLSKPIQVKDLAEAMRHWLAAN